MRSLWWLFRSSIATDSHRCSRRMLLVVCESFTAEWTVRHSHSDHGGGPAPTVTWFCALLRYANTKVWVTSFERARCCARARRTTSSFVASLVRDPSGLHSSDRFAHLDSAT